MSQCNCVGALFYCDLQEKCLLLGLFCSPGWKPEIILWNFLVRFQYCDYEKLICNIGKLITFWKLSLESVQTASEKLSIKSVQAAFKMFTNLLGLESRNIWLLENRFVIFTHPEVALNLSNFIQGNFFSISVEVCHQ